MAYRRSQRRASEKATQAISATVGVSKRRRWAENIPKKYRCSGKSPRLRGTLTTRKTGHMVHLAQVWKAKRLQYSVGHSDDPIQKFNDLEISDKKILMNSLLKFWKPFHALGRAPAPANEGRVGLLVTKRDAFQRAPLHMGDENMVPRGKSKREYAIHGQPRWPPVVDNSGDCSCSIEMDADGCVDLEHDIRCLRRHFTTRWAVLKDEIDELPRGRDLIDWHSYELAIKTEGKTARLWVNITADSVERIADPRNMRLEKLISSPCILRRIVTNFGAPADMTTDFASKCCWSFVFLNIEDPSCYLYLCEHKGVPTAQFCGGKKASNEALQLLEWLVGDNCLFEQKPRRQESKGAILRPAEIKRLANAKELSRIVRNSDDPIQEFNDLEKKQKEQLMNSLLRSCKLFHRQSWRVALADFHNYAKFGLPATERAVLLDTPLASECTSACPLVVMDADGCVDLEHDPHCLRNYFTTRWCVLMDQNIRDPPERRAYVQWSDADLLIETKSNETGLWVETSLSDIISPDWLLYRISVNFGAQPLTSGDYECPWSFTIWNLEDPTCCLKLIEHEGQPVVYFCGGEKGSNEAIQLVKWLCGCNCAHPYGMHCGTYA